MTNSSTSYVSVITAKPTLRYNEFGFHNVVFNDHIMEEMLNYHSQFEMPSEAFQHRVKARQEGEGNKTLFPFTIYS